MFTKLNKEEIELIKNILNGLVSNYSPEQIKNIKEKLSYTDYVDILKITPKMEISQELIDDLIKKDLKSISRTLQSTSKNFFEQGNLDSAFNYSDRALDLYESVKDSSIEINAEKSDKRNKIQNIIGINVGGDKYIHRPNEVRVLGAEIKFITDNLYDFHPDSPNRKKIEKNHYNQIIEFLDEFKKELIDNSKLKKEVILFPELSVPLNFKDENVGKKVEQILEEFCQKNDVIIICGCMYEKEQENPKAIKNFAKILIPDKENLNPKKYEYIKCYLSKYEFQEEKFKKELTSGKNFFIFKNSSIGDFSLMICSDYEQAHLLQYLVGEIDILFVLEANRDQDTYLDRARSWSKHYYYFQLFLNIRSYQINKDIKYLSQSAVYGPFVNPKERKDYHRKEELNQNYESLQIAKTDEKYIDKPAIFKWDIKIDNLRKKIFSSLDLSKEYYLEVLSKDPLKNLSIDIEQNFANYDPRNERILFFPDWIARLLFFEEYVTCKTKSDMQEFFSKTKVARERKDEILETICDAYLYQFKASDYDLNFEIDKVNSTKLETIKKYKKGIKLLGYGDYYQFSIIKELPNDKDVAKLINYAIATLLYCFSTTRLANLFNKFDEIEEIYSCAVEKLENQAKFLNSDDIKKKIKESLTEILNKSNYEIIYGFIKKFRDFDTNFEDPSLVGQKISNISKIIIDRLMNSFNTFITLLEGFSLYYRGRFEELKFNDIVFKFYQKFNSKSLLENFNEKLKSIHISLSNEILYLQLKKKQIDLNIINEMDNLIETLIDDLDPNINNISKQEKINNLNQISSKINISRYYEDAEEKFIKINALYYQYICRFQIVKRDISKYLMECHDLLINNRIEEFLNFNKKISSSWREISEIREEKIGDLNGKGHDYFFKIINRTFGREIQFLSLVAPYLLKEATFTHSEVRFQLFFYSTLLNPPVIYGNINILFPKALSIIKEIDKNLQKLLDDPRIKNQWIREFLKKNSIIYSNIKDLLSLMEQKEVNYNSNFDKIIQTLIYQGLLFFFKFDYFFALKCFTLIWCCLNIKAELDDKNKNIKYLQDIIKIFFNIAISKVNTEKYSEVIAENKEILSLIPKEENCVNNLISWFNNLIKIFKDGISKYWDVIPDKNQLEEFEEEIEIQQNTGLKLYNEYTELNNNFRFVKAFLNKISDENLKDLKEQMFKYLQIQSYNRYGWSAWKKGNSLLYQGNFAKKDINTDFKNAKFFFLQSQIISGKEFNEYERRRLLLDLEIHKYHLFKFKYSSKDDLLELENEIKITCKKLKDLSVEQGDFGHYLMNYMQKRIYNLIFNWLRLLINYQTSSLEESIQSERNKLSNFFEYLNKLKLEKFNNYIRYHKEDLFRPLCILIDLSIELLEILKLPEKCEKRDKLNEIIESINLEFPCFKKIKIFQTQSIILHHYAKLIDEICDLAKIMESTKQINVKKEKLDSLTGTKIKDTIKKIQISIDNLKKEQEKNMFRNHTVSIIVLDKFNQLLLHLIEPSQNETIGEKLQDLKTAIDGEGKLKAFHIPFYNYINDIYMNIQNGENQEEILNKFRDFPNKISTCLLEGIFRSICSLMLLTVGRERSK